MCSATDRWTRVPGTAGQTVRGGAAPPGAAAQGEGFASLWQPLKQAFMTAQAAADGFDEINSPNENSSKEMY